MSETGRIITIEGLQETIDKLSLFESQRLNDFLLPAMRQAGSLGVKTEKSFIERVTGATQKGIHSKTAVHGIGFITTEINPFKGGKGVSGFVVRFLDEGAKWSGRGNEVTTWRGVEHARNALGGKRSGKGEPSIENRKTFISGLQEWAVKKLGVGQEESLRVAFAIRQSIVDKGLKGGKKIIERTENTIRPQVISIINQAVAQFLEAIKR